MPTPDFLTGKTLRWQSWDPAGRITAALKEVMQTADDSQHWQLVRVQELSQMSSKGLDIGLALWVVDGSQAIGEVAFSVRQVADIVPSRRRVCFLHDDASDYSSLLVEAGAQIVASQLPFLIDTMPKLLSEATDSICGTHPFTVGLLQRLPWKNAVDNRH